MNRLIITHTLTAGQQTDVFGCDVGFDLMYISKNIIEELDNEFVYLIPLCFDQPDDLKEEEFDVFNHEQFFGGIEDFRVITDNPEKPDGITVIITIDSDKFEDFLDVFNKETFLSPDEWKIEPMIFPDGINPLPLEICIIPENLYENPSDIDSIRLCTFGQFVSNCIFSQPYPDTVRMLSSEEIEKTRKRNKKRLKVKVDTSTIFNDNTHHDN